MIKYIFLIFLASCLSDDTPLSFDKTQPDTPKTIDSFIGIKDNLLRLKIDRLMYRKSKGEDISPEEKVLPEDLYTKAKTIDFSAKDLAPEKVTLDEEGFIYRWKARLLDRRNFKELERWNETFLDENGKPLLLSPNESITKLVSVNHKLDLNEIWTINVSSKKEYELRRLWKTKKKLIIISKDTKVHLYDEAPKDFLKKLDPNIRFNEEEGVEYFLGRHHWKIINGNNVTILLEKFHKKIFYSEVIHTEGILSTGEKLNLPNGEYLLKYSIRKRREQYKVNKKSLDIMYFRRLCDGRDKGCEYSQPSYKKCKFTVGEKVFGPWIEMKKEKKSTNNISLETPIIKKMNRVKLGVIDTKDCRYNKEMNFRILDKKNAPRFILLEEHYETFYNVLEYI